MVTSSAKTMDTYTKIRIRNIINRSNINNTADNFNKLAEVINQKNIVLYQLILNIIKGCIIIHENHYCLKIEIEAESNKKLLEDIGKLFFIKIYKNRRSTDFRFNLFFTVLIYKF